MSCPSLSMRLLHTSLPHRQPAGAKTSRDVLASALSKAAAGSSSTAPAAEAAPSALDSARRIFESLSAARPRTEVNDKRRLFRANSTAAPSAFLQTSLYPTQRPFPRQPLLGPPKKIAKRIDPFYLTASSPMEHDLNPLFPLAFVNPMGKIKGRNETGLTWKNQRKIGKLVRRARAMGLVSRWTNQPVPGGLGSGRVY